MQLFKIIPPKTDPVPIVISVPHSGTKFPSELKGQYRKQQLRHLDDTDWYVHKLYDFASELGITLIKANLSRWVIDLNRDPESVPLYNDDRLITSITPTTDFYGNNIYKKGKKPDSEEITRRLNAFYWPYYKALEQLLNERKTTFGKVVLWDAHSIRHRVSTIQEDPFPDMILGNNDEKTAHSQIITTALEQLSSSNYHVQHNTPFKGGHITRYFGKPAEGTHCLQLEMNKTLYMDDNEITYNKRRAKEVKKVLRATLEHLAITVNSLV